MQPGLAIIAAVCCDGKMSLFKCGKGGVNLHFLGDFSVNSKTVQTGENSRISRVIRETWQMCNGHKQRPARGIAVPRKLTKKRGAAATAGASRRPRHLSMVEMSVGMSLD
ncbi:unnamed protein product [Ixodes persulcatus]